MSNIVLIIGDTGTGKSSSIANLNSKETFIINVLNKPLPFKGYKKNYVKIENWEDRKGNYLSTANHEKLLKHMKIINEERPEIKNIIIDDFTFIMATEFMNRCLERGFDKFADIANHSWQIMKFSNTLRDDLNIFLIGHSDRDEFGVSKLKTIGKMTDNYAKIETMATTILHSVIIDNKYFFQTNIDARYLAKSPLGMFDDKYIPNDLLYIKESINKYYEGE